MFLALIFSTISLAAPQVYEGQVHATATSFSGKTFNRKFAITANYNLAQTPQAPETTELKYYCDYDDDMQPKDCAYFCETTANFVLGSAVLKIEDKDNGRSSTEILPVTAAVSKRELRGTQEICRPLSLEGEALHSIGLTANLKEENGNWLQVTVDPFDSATMATDHVVRSSLRSLNDGRYEVLPSQAPSSTRVFWSYSHTTSWGTSGDERLRLAK